MTVNLRSHSTDSWDLCIQEYFGNCVSCHIVNVDMGNKTKYTTLIKWSKIKMYPTLLCLFCKLETSQSCVMCNASLRLKMTNEWACIVTLPQIVRTKSCMQGKLLSEVPRGPWVLHQLVNRYLPGRGFYCRWAPPEPTDTHHASAHVISIFSNLARGFHTEFALTLGTSMMCTWYRQWCTCRESLALCPRRLVHGTNSQTCGVAC